MKHWSSEDFLDGSAPFDVSQAFERLARELGAIEGAEPRVTSIGASDLLCDNHLWEALIEIAPGLTLAVAEVDSGFAEELSEEEAAEEFVAAAVEGARQASKHAVHIGSLIDETRRAIRAVVADWHFTGFATGLVDVRLAPCGCWAADETPVLEIVMEGLDDALRAGTVSLMLDEEKRRDHLTPVLEEYRSTETNRRMARANLARQEASHSIDAVALNALATHVRGEEDELAAALRTLGQGGRVDLADGAVLWMHRGNVGLSEAYGAAARCDGDRVVVATTFVPASQLDEAIGKPVTDLVIHDLLTPDMTVRSAKTSIDEGIITLSIDMEMPRHCFCRSTGRHWPMKEFAPPKSNVIPLQVHGRQFPAVLE